MTQAAVSHQIKVLEDRIGQRLFRRIRRRVELNEVGGVLLPQVSRALDLLENAFAQIRTADDDLLTVSASSTFSQLWLAARLGQFQVLHPELALRLLASNELVDFTATLDVDVAIRSGKGDWEGVHRELLVALTFTPMCSPALLKQHGGKIEARQLAELPRINADDPLWDEWFMQAGVPQQGPAQPGRLRLDSHVNEGQTAIASQGFALLSPFLWRDAIGEGKLVELFPAVSTERKNYGYWFVCPEHRLRTPKVTRFRAWLEDQLS